MAISPQKLFVQEATNTTDAQG